MYNFEGGEEEEEAVLIIICLALYNALGVIKKNVKIVRSEALIM